MAFIISQMVQQLEPWQTLCYDTALSKRPQISNQQVEGQFTAIMLSKLVQISNLAKQMPKSPVTPDICNWTNLVSCLNFSLFAGFVALANILESLT